MRFFPKKDSSHVIFRCDELPKPAECDFDVVFVEICCAEASALAISVSKKLHRVLVLRVTKQASIQEHGKKLCSFLQSLKRRGCKIFAHVSAPCTGGSNLLNLSDNREELKEKRRATFYEILDASWFSLKQVDGFSFELPVRCNYWKDSALHEYLKSLSHHLRIPILGTLVKLCALKVCVSDGLPVGKTFLFLSTCPSIITELVRFRECNRSHHAALSQVKWERTECYPELLCDSYAKGLFKHCSNSADSVNKGFQLYNPTWSNKMFLYNPNKFQKFPL